MPLPVIGVLCALGAGASVALLILLWPDLSIILVALAFAFAVYAHGAFFRPQMFREQAWREVISWGQTEQPPASLAGHVQNRGIIIGTKFYLAALAVFTLVLLMLGLDQISVAYLVAAPFALLGLATFVWMIVLRFRAAQRERHPTNP